MSVVKLIAFMSCNMLFHCIVYLWQNNICDMAATGNLVLRLQNINNATKSHDINDWKRLIVKNNELGKHLCYVFGSRVISCHFLWSCKGLLQGWLLSANVTASGKFSVLTFVFQFQMFYHITRIISTAFCTSSWYFCGAKFAVCHVWVAIINGEIFPHCWAWHSVAAAGVSVHWKFYRWCHGVSVFGIGVFLRVRVHELSIGPDTDTSIGIGASLIFFNKRSKGLTMHIYFHSLLWLYLPKVQTILTTCVYIVSSATGHLLDEAVWAEKLLWSCISVLPLESSFSLAKAFYVSSSTDYNLEKNSELNCVRTNPHW